MTTRTHARCTGFLTPARLTGLATIVLGLAAGGCAAAVGPTDGAVDIQHVEVTQGIQNYLNQIPLIAGKSTFVRVMVRGNTGGGMPLPEVSARLSIDGGPAIEPTGVRALVPPVGGSNPRSLADSFLFRVPASATGAGTRSVHLQLVQPDGSALARPGATSVDLPMRFGPNDPPVALRVYGVRYGYHNIPSGAQAHLGLTSDRWPARGFDAFEAQRAGAENMLPLASLTIDRLPGDPVGDFDCRFSGPLEAGGCDGYVDARPWAASLIDAAHPEGGAVIVILQPEISGGHDGFWFRSARGNQVINLQGDTVDVGSTLAHEIGHGLGLLHTFDDPNYPRANSALGDFNALRATPDPVLIPGQDAAGNSTANDLMGYLFNNWISPYNYCRALVATSGDRLRCPPTLDGWN